MRKLIALCTIAICPCLVVAGGVERSPAGVGLLFEDGNHFEFSVGTLRPNVSGTADFPFVLPDGSVTIVNGNSGNVAEDYSVFSAGYRWDSNGPLALTVLFDNGYGADVDYPRTAIYPLAGSNATLSTLGLQALASYSIGESLTLYGGPRAIRTKMDIELPALGYTAFGEQTWSGGMVAGAAYEKPDIALRAALTWYSPIDYSIATTENDARSPDTDVTVPQTVNLDFQTGIMQDTLLFGSIRWAEWTEFDITPFGFNLATGGSLVSYENDITTYSIGLARRFTNVWSGALSFGYEKSNGEFVSNLGPSDGYSSISLAAIHTKEDVTVTIGASYIMVGDAATIVSADPLIISDFSSNTSLALGLKVSVGL